MNPQGAAQHGQTGARRSYRMQDRAAFARAFERVGTARPPQPVPADAELARDVVCELIDRKLVTDPDAAEVVRATIEIAGRNVRTVTKLARYLGCARRTVGRRYEGVAVGVPSDWLRLGRLLKLALHMQRGRRLGRAYARCGYPDPFTASNQMKRVLGMRPTEAAKLDGWRPLVDAFVRRRVRGGSS